MQSVLESSPTTHDPGGVYGYDANASWFTSKERDAETGLDYFGARYFSSAQGRFTSPDWSATPQAVPYADLSDPQTLNLYSYTRNNPLSHRDLDGHADVLTDFGNFVGTNLEQSGIPVLMKTGAAIIFVSGVLSNADARQAIKNAANEALKAVSSAQDDGTAAAEALQGRSSEGKPGTLGKPDHQQTVKDEAERINGQPEVKIPTPEGSKGSRRADAVGTNPETGQPEIVQVYRPTPGGNIPRREKTAASDIEKATGIKPTLVPVRPLPPPKPQVPQN